MEDEVVTSFPDGSEVGCGAGCFLDCLTNHLVVGRRVDAGGGDVGVAEEFLDVREWHSSAQHLHSAGMPKLMSMDPLGKLRTILSRGRGMFVQQIGDIVLAHLMVLTGPDRIEKGCFLCGRAGVELVQVLVEVTPGLVHDGDRSSLSSFPRERHAASARSGVDVCRRQVKDFLDAVKDFLDAGGGIENEQDDGGISQATAGVLSWCPDQRVD